MLMRRTHSPTITAITTTISDTFQACRECCGGQGYLSENLIAGMRADQDIHVTFDGDNTVLKQQVAKDLLDQYRRQFAKGSYTGMLSFLGTRVWNVVDAAVFCCMLFMFVSRTFLC